MDGLLLIFLVVTAFAGGLVLTQFAVSLINQILDRKHYMARKRR